MLDLLDDELNADTEVIEAVDTKFENSWILGKSFKDKIKVINSYVKEYMLETQKVITLSYLGKHVLDCTVNLGRLCFHWHETLLNKKETTIFNGTANIFIKDLQTYGAYSDYLNIIDINKEPAIILYNNKIKLQTLDEPVDSAILEEEPDSELKIPDDTFYNAICKMESTIESERILFVDKTIFEKHTDYIYSLQKTDFHKTINILQNDIKAFKELFKGNTEVGINEYSDWLEYTNSEISIYVKKTVTDIDKTYEEMKAFINNSGSILVSSTVETKTFNIILELINKQCKSATPVTITFNKNDLTLSFENSIRENTSMKVSSSLNGAYKKEKFVISLAHILGIGKSFTSDTITFTKYDKYVEIKSGSHSVLVLSVEEEE